ncbi:HIT family protein [Variovorax sp. KK3]|uniref:HIT family protein n=1 Tax=Variovorax sp. KK3 TaxID=1855728 RepID=UPI00097C44B7|nr:HIT family protein [Variovorax sp. KK3]
MKCIFCQIVHGLAPAHRIWEDENHLAFLSRHPNTAGFTVLITKEHKQSYLFDLEDDSLARLAVAAKKVGRLLDEAFEDVGRTGCIMEGFGVDHAHVKLFPMHGTTGPWRPIKSNVDKYFSNYEGYISSHDHMRADDGDLAKLAGRIKAKGQPPLTTKPNKLPP